MDTLCLFVLFCSTENFSCVYGLRLTQGYQLNHLLSVTLKQKHFFDNVLLSLSYLTVGLAGLRLGNWSRACQFTWDSIMSINPADQQKKLQSRILLPCGSFLCSLLVSLCLTRKRFRKFKCVVDRCRAHPDSADYNI